MNINNQKFESLLQAGDRFERDSKFGQYPVEGKSGAFCADRVNLERFVTEMMEGDRYLEIGTFDGVTLSILADKFPDKEFHAIDAFIKGENTASGCLQYFIENNHDMDNVFVYPQTSDADHSYEWVKKDIEVILPFIRPGGIISFHDYNMEGVKVAVDECFNNQLPPLQFGEIVYFKLSEIEKGGD